jgi:hypothetical protein
MWAVIDQLAGEPVSSKLNGILIHSLDNIMTMDPNMHHFFDRLDIWFEATVRDFIEMQEIILMINQTVTNQYTVHATHIGFISFPKSIQPLVVTFTTPDAVKLPVPNPRYLQLHMAAAKSAHLSGAGACINQTLEDLTDNGIMADDSEFPLVLAAALELLHSEATVDT